MSEYIFHLGSFPDLARAELTAVLGTDHTLKRITPSLLQTSLTQDSQAQQYMSRLGGTVKISRILAKLEAVSAEIIAQHIHDLYHEAGKIQFGCAELNRDHLPVIEPMQIKHHLAELGMQARYVESKRYGLSASVLLHQQKVIEFVVISVAGTHILAQTVAIQNIDFWTVKDRTKPYFNRKKGMLPPKIARIMLNLAIGTTQVSDITLLDPFCGTGTILIEALDMCAGTVYGTDIDQEATQGTQRNLEWFSNTYKKPSAWHVYTADATHLEPTLFTQPVTHLVTEPFLGKQTPQPNQLPGMFKGLEKLYLGAFKSWTHLLADQATLVVVLPIIDSEFARFEYSWKRFLDKIGAFGYTTTSEPLEYSRPSAVIKRQITQIQFVRG